ncbi:hypothetical protein KAI92_03190 [Candidatus Parcubacteria bacterium]|nr:hypothetical protein [Candidatus Parcubacteria bacterium]
MLKQLQKAIELAKKTGDKIIVFDNPQSENAFVVMPFDKYEQIVSKASSEKTNLNNPEKKDYLTQNKKNDNMNQEMAEWKNGHNFGVSKEIDKLDFHNMMDEEDYEEDYENYNNEIEEDEEKDEDYYSDDFNDEFDNEYEEKYLSNKPRANSGSWSIPRNRKTGATEMTDEEEHYFEKIPF